MNTKITLNLNKQTIQLSKRYARKQKTSISKMVETYLEKITQSSNNEISPLVKSLSGILKKKGASEEAYADYLESKYK